MTDKHDYQESLNALELWNESRKEHAVTVVPDDKQVSAAISALTEMIRIERKNLVIVPKFPTREMQSAAAKLTLSKDWEDIHQNEVYQAMIKAAIDNGANHYEVMNIIAEKGK